MITAYNLRFSTPVHFGLEGIGQERIDHTIHSDTLWGAIIDKWLLLYDDDPEVLCASSSFSVSSCFPLINGQRYYPIPLGSFDKVLDDVAHLPTGSIPFGIKEVKKIRYVVEPLFFKILSGKSVEISDLNEASVYPFPVEIILEEKKSRCFSVEYQRPRVAVDQLMGGVKEGAFFYCSDQYFENGSGLFFLASFKNGESKRRFEGALRLLGDFGIGADRTIGKGYFDFISLELKNQQTNSQDMQVLLSLYYPTRQEVDQGILNDPVSAYSLFRRSGHAGSCRVNRYRRADCWMLAEGSVLPTKPAGAIPCVLKQSDYIPHNVYRYGKAFCLPIKKRGER